MLTEVDRYPAWNPFITFVDGALREGGKLRVRIEPPGRRAVTFEPTVVALAQERELRWRGRLLIPGLLDGERIELEVHAWDGRQLFAAVASVAGA